MCIANNQNGSVYVDNIKYLLNKHKKLGSLKCIVNTKKIYKCKTLNEYTVEKNTSKEKLLYIAHFVQVPIVYLIC